MTQKDFVILNSHVTVVYLRLQKHQFSRGEIANSANFKLHTGYTRST